MNNGHAEQLELFSEDKEPTKPWSLRLEVLRIKLGVSRQTFSEMLGISVHHYSHLATGYRVPNLTLRKLVVVFELNSDPRSLARKLGAGL